MNAISLYVSTSRLILQCDDGDNKNLTDLYRLLPYLRQSLSCKFCGNLLAEPYSPNNSKCQHHVCKRCIDLRKTLKTSCMSCCDKQNFVENRQLRILLQCYKSLCEHIILTPLYQEIRKQTLVPNKNCNSDQTASASSNTPTNSVLDLIDEGAKFHDDFNSHTTGLSKSAYSILPCLYTTTQTNSATQTQNNASKFVATTPSTTVCVPLTSVSVASTVPQQLTVGNNALNTFSNQLQKLVKEEAVIYQPATTVMQQQQQIQVTQQPHTIQQTTTTSPSVYSVLYAGSGNKITIKRKLENNIQQQQQHHHHQQQQQQQVIQTSNNTIIQNTVPANFKKPTPSVTYHNANVYKPKIVTTTVGTNVTTTGVQSNSNTNSAINISAANQLKRKGCRCGNATLTPGKLTCCGQRCPCYVESKSCIDCKCRGCRNPHHPNGFKVRPHLAGANQIVVTKTPQTQNHPQAIQPAPILRTYSTQPSPIATIASCTSSVQQHQQQQHQQQHNQQQQQQQQQQSTTPVSSQQIFINDLNQLQLAANTFQTNNSCLPFTQFINSNTLQTTTVTAQGNHQGTTYTSNNLQPTNFSQLLNNTIIFNPADIPTIIDGGSIQTAEISIDL